MKMRFNRVFKNKHQAVSQASSFEPPASSRLHVSIYKSRTTPDHGFRRSFLTLC
jgi:hypothetical protein